MDGEKLKSSCHAGKCCVTLLVNVHLVHSFWVTRSCAQKHWLESIGNSELEESPDEEGSILTVVEAPPIPSFIK